MKKKLDKKPNSIVGVGTSRIFRKYCSNFPFSYMPYTLTRFEDSIVCENFLNFPEWGENL